jgi:hypothetical protein
MPRVPIGANAANFANSANNKRRGPIFNLRPSRLPHSLGRTDIDPDGHFEPDKVLRRITELETIAHKGSIITATALRMICVTIKQSYIRLGLPLPGLTPATRFLRNCALMGPRAELDEATVSESILTGLQTLPRLRCLRDLFSA